MLLLSLATRHKLTNVAFSDVVKVVSLHLPVGCAPSSYVSVYKLIRAVATSQELGSAKIVHHVCGKCGSYLQGEECNRTGCASVDGERVEKFTFLELPNDDQLKSFFESKYQ